MTLRNFTPRNTPDFMRLDRFLSNLPQGSRQLARRWLAMGHISVDGTVVTEPHHPVSAFSHISLNNQPLQTRRPRYFMLHKPRGYLSATQDPEHRTVMELLDEPNREQLHIGGRLDLHSSGLLLITDDGHWSRRLTEPDKQIAKVYLVETANPIHPDTAKRFAEGIYFGYEDITTKPVVLEQLGPTTARLTLHEGRYHQIKRMFGRFRNPVIQIHRQQIGSIMLTAALAPGQYRALSEIEINSVKDNQDECP